MNKLILLSPLALLAPLAAAAQTAPAAPAAASQTAPAPATGAAPAVGQTVYDPTGAVVGTIESVTPQAVVISTGTVKAAVPIASVGTSPKGPTLALTKAQLEAATQQQQAATATDFKSKLVAGATVYGTGGTSLGTIKAADDQFVTLTTPKGDVKLPVSGFGPGPQGVSVGLTAEQLDAAMKGAAPAK